MNISMPPLQVSVNTVKSQLLRLVRIRLLRVLRLTDAQASAPEGSRSPAGRMANDLARVTVPMMTRRKISRGLAGVVVPE